MCREKRLYDGNPGYLRDVLGQELDEIAKTEQLYMPSAAAMDELCASVEDSDGEDATDCSVKGECRHQEQLDRRRRQVEELEETIRDLQKALLRTEVERGRALERAAETELAQASNEAKTSTHNEQEADNLRPSRSSRTLEIEPQSTTTYAGASRLEEDPEVSSDESDAGAASPSGASTMLDTLCVPSSPDSTSGSSEAVQVPRLALLEIPIRKRKHEHEQPVAEGPSDASSQKRRKTQGETTTPYSPYNSWLLWSGGRL
jgi:hypothetical protein